MKRIIYCILVLCLVCCAFVGCSSQAYNANHNISEKAREFQVERRVTVYNAVTDTIIFEIEGFIDISNSATNELTITAKVGENMFKKNYVYLGTHTLYVVEDIDGTHTDPYHYKIYFYVNRLPDFDVVGG